jgi:hypothetical protein
MMHKKTPHKNDRIYRPEDEAAEKKIGGDFAAAWGLEYQQFGGMSRFDGLLIGRENSIPSPHFIFELKNRNVRCDGDQVFPTGAAGGYPTLPLSKEKVESLYAEAIRRGVPALLVFYAKDGETTWWVDIARCLNLRVHHNSGRTKTPMRPSDVEDCVYIPICWFMPMEWPYQWGAGTQFGMSCARVQETQQAGECQ